MVTFFMFLPLSLCLLLYLKKPHCNLKLSIVSILIYCMMQRDMNTTVITSKLRTWVLSCASCGLCPHTLKDYLIIKLKVHVVQVEMSGIWDRPCESTDVREGPVWWWTLNSCTKTDVKRGRKYRTPHCYITAAFLGYFFSNAFSFSSTLSCLCNLSLRDKLAWWFCLAELSNGHEECDLRGAHKRRSKTFFISA